MSFYQKIEELEFKLLTDALKEHHSIRKAAKNLLVSEPTVRTLMKRFNMSLKKCRCEECAAEDAALKIDQAKKTLGMKA